MPHPHPARPSWIASILGSSVVLLALCAGAGAATLEVSFDATVSSVFGDLDGPVVVGSTVSGTVVLDDAVVGTYTAAGNPTFQRDEMRYVDAIVSTSLEVDGQPVSGVGGDLLLLDAKESLAGEDNYEIQAVLDTGTLGSASPISITLTGEYGFETFTLSGTDPLPGPPPFDAGRFNPFTLQSASGGSAFGQLDALAAAAPPPAVPFLSPFGALGLVSILVASGAIRTIQRSR